MVVITDILMPGDDLGLHRQPGGLVIAVPLGDSPYKGHHESDDQQDEHQGKQHSKYAKSEIKSKHPASSLSVFSLKMGAP